MSWETVKALFTSNWVKELWDAFEIQSLVLTSLGFQVVLAICGSRRKYNSRIKMRFIVWFCYLMGTYVSTVALGKLTETNNDSIALTSITYGGDPKVNITNNELRALWAPLLLIHIGGPDGITAYAVEDNRLGWRQFIELGVQIGVVALIFIKSWNNTWLSITALALVLTGAIKSYERIWALRRSASSDDVFPSLSNTSYSDPHTSSAFSKSSSSYSDLALLVKAYRRFEHLKPHLQDWVGQPLSINFPSLSTYYYNPQHVFRITEFELGFMYDVLFTRLPANYSVGSLIRRSICFFCLVSSLCGFAILFRHADVKLLQILVSRKYDKNADIAITYALLSGAIALEVYAIRSIISSDWTTLFTIQDPKNLLVQLVGPLPDQWPRWSDCMEQFNLLEYCDYKETSISGRIIIKVLKDSRLDKIFNFQSYRVTKCKKISTKLKTLIIEQIDQVSGQRVWQPFNKIGEWALERFKCVDQFKWSIQTEFSNEANQQTSFLRAITIWHIATYICYTLEAPKHDEESLPNLTLMLSNYMMHLLAEHPQMLSISSKQFLLECVCEKFKAFWNKKFAGEKLTSFLDKMVKERDEDLVMETPSEIQNNAENQGRDKKVAKNTEIEDIVSSWEVVLEVKLLAERLRHRNDRWDLLSSVWVEMLCYAAYNCPWVHHTQQLTRGGGLITHVWLLLSHETNKFNICIY